MPKGLKETSSLITIGFSTTEAVAGTMSQTKIDLQLNVLDREVFVGIIATNDFFGQIVGVNNVNVKSLSGRIFGVRAQASADIFAALTQSELLSA